MFSWVLQYLIFFNTISFFLSVCLTGLFSTHILITASLLYDPWQNGSTMYFSSLCYMSTSFYTEVWNSKRWRHWETKLYTLLKIWCLLTSSWKIKAGGIQGWFFGAQEIKQQSWGGHYAVVALTQTHLIFSATRQSRDEFNSSLVLA